MRSAAISLSIIRGRFFRSRYPAASYETSEWTVKDTGRNRLGPIQAEKMAGLGPLKRAIFSQTHAPRDMTFNSLPAEGRHSLRAAQHRLRHFIAPADSE
jgi:hypothetical protein